MQEVLRHSFSKLNFKIDTKSLTEIHKKSYNDFLFGDKSVGSSISNVLATIFPINDNYGYAQIEYVSHRFTEPVYSIDECRVKSLTYASKLYVTFRLILFDVDEQKKTM